MATSFRPNGTDANNNVKADIAAVYVQDQIALSKEWKLLAGLRYDHFKTRFDDRRTTLTPATTPTTATDLARTDKEFSPRVGLIWSPTAVDLLRQLQLRVPALRRDARPRRARQNTGLSTADLAPEKAKNYEIGARWDLLPDATLSAAIFRLDRNNVRNADGNGGFVQTGQQRTEGVELGLQGDVLPYWQVYGGYAYLDAEITKASAGDPARSATARSSCPRTRFALEQVRHHPRLGCRPRPHLPGIFLPERRQPVTLPSFTRVDGALYYTFAGGKTRPAWRSTSRTSSTRSTSRPPTPTTTKPGPVSWAVARPGETVISLGRRLPGASSGLPESVTRAALHPSLRTGLLSYLALLRVGFTEPSPVTRPAGELLPHRFTLTAPVEPSGGLFSVALFRRGRPPWALPTTLPCGVRTFLPRELPRAGDHPAFSGAIKERVEARESIAPGGGVGARRRRYVRARSWPMAATARRSARSFSGSPECPATLCQVT